MRRRESRSLARLAPTRLALTRLAPAGFAPALILSLLLALVPTAYAGKYHVYSCRTPSGAPAPTSGWSGSLNGSWMYDIDSCASGGSLTAALDGAVEHGANVSDAAWTFSAPAGTQIAAARLWRAGEARTSRPYGTTVYWLAAPNDSYDAADVFDKCENAEEGCPGRGNAQIPMAQENLVEVSSGYLSGATHIYMNASCGGGNGTNCPAAGSGYSVWVSLYGADITLTDDTPPIASNVSGSLTTQATVGGVQDISFSATDTGSGLYEAVFSIDGHAVSSQPLDSGDESCRNVGGTSDGNNAFFEVEPCPLALSDDLTFNTALAPEGSHLLTVQLLDAAGNATTILNREVSIDNHPASSTPVPTTPVPTTPVPTAPGNPLGGGTPITILPGAPTTVSTSIAIAPATSASALVIGPGSPAVVRGAPNGTNASEEAKLTARWASTAKQMRTAGYGALDRITGRLTSISGQAIAGATLDVYETPASHGAVASRIGGVSTGPTGQWTMTLPRGVSSSTLRFAYRSHVNDTVDAATAVLTLRVHAGIALRIAPRVASIGRKIFFSGVLHGAPIPEDGKQLVLEARSGKEGWIQFNTIHTDTKGRYRASYRFKFPGPITYQFRVISRLEADFPFLEGASNVIDVHER